MIITGSFSSSCDPLSVPSTGWVKRSLLVGPLSLTALTYLPFAPAPAVAMAPAAPVHALRDTVAALLNSRPPSPLRQSAFLWTRDTVSFPLGIRTRCACSVSLPSCMGPCVICPLHLPCRVVSLAARPVSSLGSRPSASGSRLSVFRRRPMAAGGGGAALSAFGLRRFRTDPRSLVSCSPHCPFGPTVESPCTMYLARLAQLSG